MPVFLPADTRDVLGAGANLCESIALLQQKFPFIDTEGRVKQHHRLALDQFLSHGADDLRILREQAQKEANHPNANKAAGGRAMLEALAALLPRTPIVAVPSHDTWTDLLPERRRRRLTLAAASRLIVGHANGVIENSGLTLHRSRGVPVIPGAAIKNAAVRAAHMGYDYSDAERADLFGAPGHASRIAYLDAVPAKGAPPVLEYEISNPHYTAFYSGNTRNPQALDTENPNPVVFPAVAAGARFTFTLLLARPTGNPDRDAYLLDQAEALVHAGLTCLGVGAKTASGHGYFAPDVEQFEQLTEGQPTYFVLLTPAITAGARQTHPELRVASIRGQLRQIYRMLGATPADEHALFGGIGRNLPATHPRHKRPVASAISLRLELHGPAFAPIIVPLCPHDRRKGERLAVPRGTVYRLVWRDRFEFTDPLGAASRAKAFRRVLTAWLMLGGVGCRSTRAAGSVAMLDQKTLSPIPFPHAQFSDLLQVLALPATLRCAVLGDPNDDPEALRKIATDTVNGLGPGVIRGDPLGYVGNGRKVSPLKLKIGRFEDGYRLIAVWDNRHGRGGDLRDAIAKLQQRNKHLGRLLAESDLAK